MATRRDKERRRGKRRENRHEKRQQQHSGGGEWDCIRIPDGVEVFKPERDTTYHIDVIPYIVGGLNPNAEKGDEYFELSYPVYRSLGIDEKRYIAIGELLGQRDPVAEHFAQLRKQGAEWDAIKQFKPTFRQLMLFFVHEQPEKGLQLFEGAYGTFGELLDEEIKANEEEYIDNFDDPDGGATLEVRFKAKNIGQQNPWVLASKINFQKRTDGFDANGDPKLAKEVLEKAAGICLDDMLKITDYDTLQKILFGEPMPGRDTDEGGNDDEPEVPPKRTGKPTPPTEDDDDDEAPPPKKKPPTAEDLGITKGSEVEHDAYGVCTVVRISRDGQTLTLTDEDDEIYKGIDVTDVEPMGNGGGTAAEPEPEPEPKPKKKSASSAAEKPQQDEGSAEPAGKSSRSKDEDDWDDDWED